MSGREGGGTTGNFSRLMGRESLTVRAGLRGFTAEDIGPVRMLSIDQQLSSCRGTTLRPSQRPPPPVVGLQSWSMLIAQTATLSATWFSFTGSFNDPR